MISPNQIAKRINMPVQEWKGNCYMIASLLIKHGIVKGKLRYGHYLGPVAKTSMFNYGQTFQRHGWVEKSASVVVDPTRWVFEDVDPYIYVGHPKDLYDVGGQLLKQAMAIPYPEDSMGRTIAVPEEVTFHMHPFHHVRDTITIEQLMWFANLTPVVLGEHAKPIYKWLEETDNAALIPIDFWGMVMEAV